MSKPAARKGDMGTGHQQWPPRANVQGSPDVFFNSLPAHRQGDLWSIHCYKYMCHPGILTKGCPTVLTNGKQQGRVDDPVNCGSKVSQGSPDIFIGGDSMGSLCTNAPSSGKATQDTLDPATPLIDGIPVGKDGSQGGTVPYYGSPGGGGPVGGTASSGGPYTNSGSQYATGTNYDPEPPNKNTAKGIGSVSSKYESNGNPGSIGYDKVGGYSYGEYQIATNTGTFHNYYQGLKDSDPDAYAKLEAAGGESAAKAGTPEFQAAWKSVAANDSNFGQTQQDFIQSTHYDKSVAKIKNQTGLDVNTRSKAVQDAVWSASVQSGPGNSILISALNGRDPNTMTDTQIINAMYDERSSTNPDGSLKYFHSSTPAIQRSVAKRLVNERKDVLAEVTN